MSKWRKNKVNCTAINVRGCEYKLEAYGAESVLIKKNEGIWGQAVFFFFHSRHCYVFRFLSFRLDEDDHKATPIFQAVLHYSNYWLFFDVSTIVWNEARNINSGSAVDVVLYFFFFFLDYAALQL